MKKALLLILIILFTTHSFADFSVTSIDVSEYPLVKTNFILTDAGGNPIEGFTEDDFTVRENGELMSATLKITCQNADDLKEVSVLLILDASGSMELQQGDTVRRWNWVEDAVEEFVTQLDFEGRTRVAVTAFENDVELRIGFSNDPDEIMDSVRATEIAGPTKYNPPFMDEFFGAYELLSKRPLDIPRAAIFLTDGLPDEPPAVDDIIDTMNAAGIKVYTVTMLTAMTTSLARIATNTGGKFFEVNEKEDLSDIYSLIAFDLQRQQLCQMTWLSDFICEGDDPNREVYLKFNPRFEGKTRNYVVPEQGYAKLEPNEEIQAFGNPEVNIPTTRTMTFTPINGGARITGTAISPDTYFSVSEYRVDGLVVETPFDVDTNQYLEVDVVFTQQNQKRLREALLNLEGEGCLSSVELLGGFTDVILVGPNGGEVYNSCDEIEIRWTGIDPSQAVDVFYSNDGGNNWTLIQSGVISGSLLWTPPAVGQNYKIRLELPEQNYFEWAYKFESSEYSSAIGIDMSLDENFVYVGGTYRSDIQFDTISYGNSGGEDIYFAKMNNAGQVVWSYRIASPGVDSLTALVVDQDDNIWITGVVCDGARIGTSILNLRYTETPYFFIAKFEPNGTVVNYVTYGATGLDPDVRMWPLGMRVIEENGRIEVVGNYRKTVDLTEFPQRILPYTNQDVNTNNNPPFILLFRDEVELFSGNRQGYDIRNYGQNQVSDANENSYFADDFIGDISFGSITLITENQSGYIAKNTKVQSSEDISVNDFRIENPTLQINPVQVQFDEILTGDYQSQVLPNAISNNGDLVYKVVNSYFTPGTEKNWNINSQIPSEISPGEQIDAEFTFNPQTTGMINTVFTIEAECGSNYTFELSGEGKCSGNALEIIDVAKRTIGVRSRVVIQDAFENISTVPVVITPVIENDANGEFEVFAFDGTNETINLSVPGGEFADLVIYYTPQSESVSNATVNYGLVADCDQASSNLTGEGVSSQVIGDDVLVENRIRTLNNATIVLENFGDLDVTISNIRLRDQINELTLPGLQPSYTIQSGKTQNIDLQFISEVESEFNTVLLAETESGDVIEMVNITCRALNPQVNAVFECPQIDVAVGDVGTGKITLTNPSILADAELINISSNNPDFTFNNGTTQIDIPNGPDRQLERNSIENFEIEVFFAPLAEGQSDVTFEITADIAIGNGNDESYAQDSTITLQSSCTASSSDVTNVLNLGNILKCEETVIPIRIQNPFASNLVVELSDFIITGDPSSEIEIDLAGELIITPGSDEFVDVLIKPNSLGSRSYIIQVENDFGSDIIYELNAEVVRVQLSAITEDEGIFPGDVTQATLSAQVVDLYQQVINQLTIKIDLGEKMVKFESNSIENLVPGNWTWENPVELSQTVFTVTGTGEINTPYNGDLFNFDYEIYLDSTFESEIDFSVVGTYCEGEPQDGFRTYLDEVCIPKFRMITFGEEFGLQEIAPNPVSDEVELSMNIPFDTFINVEIFDYSGNSVYKVYSGQVSKGKYDMLVPVNSIPSGSYFVRLTSKTRYDVKGLIIQK